MQISSENGSEVKFKIKLKQSEKKGHLKSVPICESVKSASLPSQQHIIIQAPFSKECIHHFPSPFVKRVYHFPSPLLEQRIISQAPF